MNIADMTMTDLVHANAGPQKPEQCPVARRIEADIRIIEQRIQFESSEAIRRGLKLALTQFRNELDTHQKCFCEEAA